MAARKKKTAAPSFLAFVADLGVTLEPGQRVFWSIAADGVEPGELRGADRALARAFFGDVDTIPAGARSVVAAVKGAEIGWSFVLGLRLLYRALTADISDAAPGEVRSALCVAPDVRTGRIPIRVAREFAERHPTISGLIENPTTDGFIIRRENGRTAVECLPASVGGRATRGRRFVEVALDEASMFRDESGAVSDRDVFRSVVTRCKGTTWLGSTPWLPSNLLWKLVEDNWGRPTKALAARLPTESMRSNKKVLADVARVRALDPIAASVEYDCELPSASTLFFDSVALDAAMVDELPAVGPSDALGAGADLGLKRDASALVIASATRGVIVPRELLEIKPKRNQPLKPSTVFERFAETAGVHGVDSILADQHYILSLREGLEGAGIRAVESPSGSAGKLRVHETVRTLLNEGKLRFGPAHRGLVDQLRSIVALPVAGGGVVIRQPRSKYGGHCDLASAFILAAYVLARRLRRTNQPRGVPRATPRPDYTSAQYQFGNTRPVAASEPVLEVVHGLGVVLKCYRKQRRPGDRTFGYGNAFGGY